MGTVDELLAALRAGPSEELVRQLVGLYGDGLARIVALVAEQGEAGAAMMTAMTEDPLVESLLLLHDLHPLDVGARVRRALDQVRPAGGVEYLGVTDGVARLRLVGGHGCPSSTATVRRAVLNAAPEVREVVVEEQAEPALLQIGRRPAPAGAEKCEMCATEIPAGHGHVADIESSSIVCACRACYLLFTEAGGRYRAIPDRYLTDPRHPLSASDWDSLEIPVGLAFFLRGSGGITGFYPSPAGVTECRLDLRAWDQLAAGHPLLGAAAPDVEAVLISRSGAVAECFVVPIDSCYELAGRVRRQWRGFDGGEQVRASIAGFLDGVRARAATLGA